MRKRQAKKITTMSGPCSKWSSWETAKRKRRAVGMEAAWSARLEENMLKFFVRGKRHGRGTVNSGVASLWECVYVGLGWREGTRVWLKGGGWHVVPYVAPPNGRHSMQGRR